VLLPSWFAQVNEAALSLNSSSEDLSEKVTADILRRVGQNQIRSKGQGTLLAIQRQIVLNIIAAAVMWVTLCLRAY
jgi:hypothetical protein